MDQLSQREPEDSFIDNNMLNQHRHMISTHHMMTNILIKVDGNKELLARPTCMQHASS